MGDKETSDAELDELRDLLRWAYGKLYLCQFSKLDDAMVLDRIKSVIDESGATGVCKC